MPSSVAVPCDGGVMPVTASASPSTSLSLAVGSNASLPSSATVMKSCCADGGSLIELIATWSVALAVLPWPSLTV